MSGCGCASSCASGDDDPRYRRVLWWALLINGVMFGVELVAGWLSGSLALQADALDFLGDAGNYGISLAVLGAALHVRARAALFKGLCMGAFGLWVIANTLYRLAGGGLPEAEVMGVVSVMALVANLGVAWMLFRFRDGDANRESVWLCSRNDAIANLAVLAAAGGVALTGTRWPDLAVAAVIASLALSGAWRVITSALRELRTERAEEAGHESQA